MMLRKRQRARAGYTLIEVMMAIVVMTTGALALLSMQEASTHGNLEARQMTTATQFASSWLERLQRDAVAWTAGGPRATFGPTTLARTRFLNAVGAAGVAPTWFVPTAAQLGTPLESWAADHFGRETRDPAAMEFCANVRLAWVYLNQAMRADVRVWWARARPTSGADLPGCAAGVDPESLTTRNNDVRFVYVSGVLRWTPVRR